MAPPTLKEQIMSELKNPKFSTFEELKDYQFWKAVRSEFLATTMLMVILTGSFNSEINGTTCIIRDIPPVINEGCLGVKSKYDGAVGELIRNINNLTIFADGRNESLVLKLPLVTIHYNSSRTYRNLTYRGGTPCDVRLGNLRLAIIKLLQKSSANTSKLIVQPAISPIRTVPTYRIDDTNRSAQFPFKMAAIYGLTTSALLQIFGQISGGHFNPAITVSHLVTGHVTMIRATAYVTVQCLGSCMGTFLGGILTTTSESNFANDVGSYKRLKNYGLVRLGFGLSPMQGFGVEFILTFTLIMLIFTCLDPKKLPRIVDLNGNHSVDLSSDKGELLYSWYENRALKCNGNGSDQQNISLSPRAFRHHSNEVSGISGLTYYPIIVAFYICAATLFGYNLTGAAMNPAISLGPAVNANYWKDHWIYWVGPLLGAVMAAFTYEYTCTVSSNTSLDFKGPFASATWDITSWGRQKWPRRLPKHQIDQKQNGA